MIYLFSSILFCCERFMYFILSVTCHWWSITKSFAVYRSHSRVYFSHSLYRGVTEMMRKLMFPIRTVKHTVDYLKLSVFVVDSCCCCNREFQGHNFTKNLDLKILSHHFLLHFYFRDSFSQIKVLEFFPFICYCHWNVSSISPCYYYQSAFFACCWVIFVIKLSGRRWSS